MTRGLIACLFIVMVVMIMFLGFQVYQGVTTCREIKQSQQDKLKEAGKLIAMSQTQGSPAFAFEHIIIAKHLVDEVLHAYQNNVLIAERTLKLTKGKLQQTRDGVYAHYEKLAERFPETSGANWLVAETEEGHGITEEPRHHHHRSRQSKQSRHHS